jgi:hypothetical protein
MTVPSSIYRRSGELLFIITFLGSKLICRENNELLKDFNAVNVCLVCLFVCLCVCVCVCVCACVVVIPLFMVVM